MSAKPVIFISRLGLAAACLLAAGSWPVHAKPPLPTVLLYPASPGDIPAMADLRTRLRLDGVFQVLSYDTESASVQRIAAETSHPEWLVTGAMNDDARLALARALHVAFYILVSPGRQPDSTHLQMVQTAPPALTYDWQGLNRQFGAHAVESQAQAALAHPASDTGTASPPSAELAPSVTPSAPPVPLPVAPPELAAPVTPEPLAVKPMPTPEVAPLPVPAVVVPSPPAPVVKPQPVPEVMVTPPTPVTSVPVAPAPQAPKPVVVQPTPIAPMAPKPMPAIKPAPPPPVLPVVVVPSLPVQPPAVVPAPVIKSQPIPEVMVTPAPPVTVAPAPLPVPLAQPAPGSPAPVVVVPAPVVKPQPIAAPMPPAPGPQMALLPPRPLTPEPAPESETPPSPAQIIKPQARPEDLAAVSPLLNRGDAALESGDVVGAISVYRQAINGAPLSVVPRLKLAQAYQKGGLTDKALDEAKRALEIAPDSLPLQQFLTEIDTQNGTSDGAITRYRALIERDPQDPAAHSGLAEALWNDGDLSGAEAEYKRAQKLAPPEDHSADAHLAQLYATQARYEDCLTALQNAGKNGYALAIKIVRNRADTLSSTIEASRDAFTAGKSTREQFYDGAKQVSAQAQALAGFVAKITPPTEYKLSDLHRMLSTNLLAQEAATLVTFIETSDAAQSESVSKLDKEAQTEMLTAQAAEEKLGLWDGKK